MALHRLPVRRLPAALRDHWRSGGGARLVARALAAPVRRGLGSAAAGGDREPAARRPGDHRRQPPVVLRLGTAAVHASPPGVHARQSRVHRSADHKMAGLRGRGETSRRRRPGDLAAALDQARHVLDTGRGPGRLPRGHTFERWATASRALRSSAPGTTDGRPPHPGGHHRNRPHPAGRCQAACARSAGRRYASASRSGPRPSGSRKARMRPGAPSPTD